MKRERYGRQAAFACLCPGLLCTVQSELTWFCPEFPDGIFSLQKPAVLTLRIRDGGNGSCDHRNASVQREKEMVKKKGKDHTHAARDTDIQGPHSIILEVQHWTAELSTGQKWSWMWDSKWRKLISALYNYWAIISPSWKFRVGK